MSNTCSLDIHTPFLSLVDGAVVERGKPTLVQDVAVQVSLGNQSLRSKSSSEHRFDLKSASKVDRHRRHSWHNVNEYRSVPYHQYSRSVQPGCDQSIQCDLDQEYSFSNEHGLSRLEETEDESNTHDDDDEKNNNNSNERIRRSRNCTSFVRPRGS